MKIFVAYGFSDIRDGWIPKLIFPLIRAFGDEVMTGEDLQGDRVSDAVREKIIESDALIGFLTKRGDPDNDGVWRTHRWVIEELTIALNNECFVVEVKEEGVDAQGGVVGDRQHIFYKQNARDECIVEVAKVIGRWHKKRKITLQLLPDDFVQEIMPLHRKQDLRCSYTLLVENEEYPEAQTKIMPITGGLFMTIKDVPSQALVQVHIQYQEKHWRSNYENINSPGIHLIKE